MGLGLDHRVLCIVDTMGCGDSKEQFCDELLQEQHYADAIQKELTQKLSQVDRGVVVKVKFDPPFQVDPDTVIEFIRVGGAVVWYEKAKPYSSGMRIYRDKPYICAKR